MRGGVNYARHFGVLNPRAGCNVWACHCVVWFAGCALKGESEDEKKVSEGEENEGENDFTHQEKEGAEGGVKLGFFAFGHKGRGEGLTGGDDIESIRNEISRPCAGEHGLYFIERGFRCAVLVDVADNRLKKLIV